MPTNVSAISARPSLPLWGRAGVGGNIPKPDETQVGIVGAGPAGLMLSHLLHRLGIQSVVLETRSRDYVERRVRAGVLEQGSADLLTSAGVGERMMREGLSHDGINLRFAGEQHRIDFRRLTGRGITVYGQQEVVKDLIKQRLEDGGEIRFEAEATAVEAIDGDRPRIVYLEDGVPTTLQCEFVAGCDGSHGVARAALEAIPSPLAGEGQGGGSASYERTYPFAWLGILAKTPPAADELIYAYHERGFALHSMRSPEISRLYLQVDADETMDAWPEDRVWNELRLRLAEPGLQPGEIIEDGITPMRSLVTEPMQRGRLFLAGDAAHIVPATGAKGMNLALGDVRVLAEALAASYRSKSSDLLERYSEVCLRRVWRAEHFSAWMTGLLHRDPEGDPFEHKLRLSYLRYVTTSEAAATTLAENYVGFDGT
ncbi:MAG: 4-hydroxybenzoate 3-monooxygenase [Chloroflexi bacterium]|nr:MAG: 4-hydroxybenzoate 3-monooxygenase [Chloroflexota bacterium]